MPTVNLHRDGAAATIELDRPEALNAWNRALGDELLDAVRAVAEDDGVRAVVITGAGRAFSSGADLRDLSGRQERTPDGHIDVRRVLNQRYHPIITTIRTMPKPVLAAVNGPAVGIGLSLALAADLVLAAESAYFLLAFVNIGLVPDDRFELETAALLERLAAGATAAHAGIKRQLNAWLFERMDAQLALEAELQRDSAA